jgi:ATP-dependent helicase/nuclease subunit A
VRFLTVHGAKGLEAPVVFIADCAGSERDRNAWQARVDWPAEQDRPQTFLLVGRKDSRDRITQALLDRQQQAERREDANLLYVALTRARQMLIVSAAVTPDKANHGWYGLLRVQWGSENCLATGSAWIHRTGTAPTHPAASVGNILQMAPLRTEIDPRLTQPFKATPRLIRIAPSRSLVEHDIDFEIGAITDPDGRRRGIGIHRFLEWLTTPPQRTRAQLLAGLARELQRDAGDPELAEWLQEAEAVIQAPHLAALFDATRYEQVYAEVPLQYFQGEALVDGIIDRLLLDPDTAHIIDYKTHSIEAAQAETTAQTYREQLHLYAEGVRRLLPQRRVRASILFTQCRVLVDLAV